MTSEAVCHVCRSIILIYVCFVCVYKKVLRRDLKELIDKSSLFDLFLCECASECVTECATECTGFCLQCLNFLFVFNEEVFILTCSNSQLIK